jgi:hypothetical protein
MRAADDSTPKHFRKPTVTTIDLKWSAAAAQLHAPGQSRLETPLSNAIDSLLPSIGDIERASIDFNASRLTAQLGNGAVLAVGGITLGQSVITADSIRLYRDGIGSIDLPGHYTIRYAMANGTPQILGFGGQVASVAIASQWQPASAGYDAAIGNLSVRASGTLTLGGDLSVDGQLSRVEFAASSGAVRGAVEGSFGVSGQGDLDAALIAAANFDYADGSFLRVGGARIDASDLTLSGAANALGNAANFAGDDVFKLDVATSGILPMVSTGNGNDRITLTGGAHYDVDTGAGDDVIALQMGKASIQAGDGFDTAIIAGKRADFVMSHNGSWNVFVRPDGNYSAALQGVERAVFDDGAMAFDIGGHAGQVYRLYTAALGRAPDAAGLGYWIGVLDRGAALHAVASEFVRSAEFTGMVGAGADNATFVTKLYNNILHRAPEAAGLQYWQGVLDQGAGRAGMVVEFSEGAENQAQVIGVIQDGIAYTPFP